MLALPASAQPLSPEIIKINIPSLPLFIVDQATILATVDRHTRGNSSTVP
jgi:hypothetical protein